MLYLSEIWPRAVSFKALLAAASARLDGTAPPESGSTGPAQDAQLLGMNLLKAYGISDNLVEWHVHAPHFVLTPGERPAAGPVVRLLAQRGPDITNLRHEPLKVEGFNQRLLPYLDGSRDRPALLKTLAELAAAGELEIEADGRPVTDMTQVKRILPEMLESSLESLAGAALLVA